MTDDASATRRRGHPRLRARPCPPSPGVYRMIDAAGEVMYVGKARNLKARVTNYTRPEGLEVRLQRMIAATAHHGVRAHRDRGRSAAARGQPDQAAEAALQRAAARRQELPLHPHRHRARSAGADASIAAPGASKGHYFGPFASAARGQAHHHLAAEGLPAPHLLGQLLQGPHPPLHAAPDQALRRPLHRRDLDRRLWRAGRGGPPVPLRQVASPCRTTSQPT